MLSPVTPSTTFCVYTFCHFSNFFQKVFDLLSQPDKVYGWSLRTSHCGDVQRRQWWSVDEMIIVFMSEHFAQILFKGITKVPKLSTAFNSATVETVVSVRQVTVAIVVIVVTVVTVKTSETPAHHHIKTSTHQNIEWIWISSFSGLNVHGTRIATKTHSVATGTAHKLNLNESGELAAREWRRSHGTQRN
jgi:hypothetical protein